MGECTSCGDQQTANADGTACVCDESVALTCTDGSNNTWCCGGTNPDTGKEQICGATAGTCADSDGTCVYDITAPSESKKANCSYDILQYEMVPDCSYKIYQASADGAVVLEEEDSCSSQSEYCSLAYSDSAGTVAAGDSIGYQTNNTYIYGYCKKNYDYTTTPSTYFELKEKDRCEDDEYCALGYARDDCNGTASDSVGYTTDPNRPYATIYGSCKKPYVYSQECEAANGGFKMTPSTGCPAAQYCSLKWGSIENSCVDAGDDISGQIFGICLPRDNYTAPSCPVPAAAS